LHVFIRSPLRCKGEEVTPCLECIRGDEEFKEGFGEAPK
jgi:hypothetical protein